MSKSTTNKRLRAVDLYSGVGGWALGLRLAGIEVVASYERCGIANETNFKNNQHQAQTVDIRRLSLEDLPSNIDIVVGSPPCTQFSFSNRGGNGDIDDGLEDIIKFLSIVDYLKPKFWAMENVPRVVKILKQELNPGGRLEMFAHLDVKAAVINMENFGLPQRRQRCIAGNFDFGLLDEYTNQTSKRTLGSIVQGLAENPVIDPIYGLSLDKNSLRDHITEENLNEEEVRINKAGKTMHPVYNSMSFPDKLDKSVRTITATCTRVSRESIVIENPSQPGKYRRLTIRERASLQGFPVTFQFYGGTYTQKLRMVGNAIPPVFSYYVAHAMQGTLAHKVKKHADHAELLHSPVPPAIDACPNRPGACYQTNRKFRFAIPSLRLKSGVRFELTNEITPSQAAWKVAFYFGTSKSILSLSLDEALFLLIKRGLPNEIYMNIQADLSQLEEYIRHADIANMQRLWSHRGVGLTRPFMLLDQLDESGASLIDILSGHELLAQELIGQAILTEYGEESYMLPGLNKLARNASLILSGLLVGAIANIELSKHMQTSDEKLKKVAAG